MWGIPNYFSKHPNHFIFRPVLYEGYNFVSILAMLIFLIRDILMDVSYLIMGLSCISLMVKWWWASFHVLIGHLYMFFGEMPIKFFGCYCYFPSISLFLPLTILIKYITFRLMFLKCFLICSFLLRNLQCFSLAMVLNFFKTGLRPFTASIWSLCRSLYIDRSYLH